MSAQGQVEDPLPTKHNMIMEKAIFRSVYCRSGNSRDVLLFANFGRWTNSQILESRDSIIIIGLPIFEIDNS